MGGIASILEWATNTLQGVAFVELLILVGMGFMYRKMHKVETRLDDTKKAATSAMKRMPSGGDQLTPGSNSFRRTLTNETDD